MKTLLLGLLLTTFTSPTFAANNLTLTSTSFQNGGRIPDNYTCNGNDNMPQLAWTNVPTKAQSLALIVSDPDAPSGTFYHWIVYNIPTSISSFAENSTNLPSGVMVGKNHFGKSQYNGPCPPKDSTHTYVFTLYALDSKLNLPADSDALTVLKALQGHVIEQAELKGTYGR